MSDDVMYRSDRPFEAKDTRFGMVLCLGSAVVSLKIIIWLATEAAGIIMQ